MMSFGWESLVGFGLKGTPGQSAPQQKEKTDSNGIKEKVKQFLAQLLPNNYQTLKQVNSHYLTLQDDKEMMPLVQVQQVLFQNITDCCKICRNWHKHFFWSQPDLDSSSQSDIKVENNSVQMVVWAKYLPDYMGSLTWTSLFPYLSPDYTEKGMYTNFFV